MSAATSTTLERREASRRQAVALVVLCTVLGAAGQILIKTGANALPHQSTTLLGSLFAMAMNPWLVAGYTLYGIMTVLFVFALKDGELSILYPIISLTYVWVAGLSTWFFRESMNVSKLLGIAAIIAGVAVLGKDAHK